MILSGLCCYLFSVIIAVFIAIYKCSSKLEFMFAITCPPLYFIYVILEALRNLLKNLKTCPST